MFRERLELYKSQLSSTSDSDSSSKSDSESNDSASRKESVDSDSFKTASSEPLSEPSSISKLTIQDISELQDSTEFESCYEYTIEASIQLVIDSDYDSDDESSSCEES